MGKDGFEEVPDHAVKMEATLIDGEWAEECPRCRQRVPLAMGHQSYCTNHGGDDA